MSAFVLDCSAAVGLVFEDQTSPASARAEEALATWLGLVPALWWLEITNVLLVAERRGRLAAADATRALELLRALPIELEPPPLMHDRSPVLLQLGRTHGLSAYDASYLDLAMRAGLPLATADEALRAACRRTGVRLLEDV